jgi:aspartate/methionine/tyrosine aminotransferase
MNRDTRLIVLNSPCNPTGGVLEASDTKAIYEIAEKYGASILSDEVYRRMTYGPTPASVTAFDHCRERTILLGGVSKAYAMTGFRVGYLIGPRELVKKVGLYVETVASCISPFVQLATVEALLGDQSCVDTMMAELKKRRDLLVDGLNGMKGIECLTPRGGIFVFPRVTGTGYSSDEFVELMLSEGGVSLVPGHVFGAHGRNHVRISFTTSLDNIAEGLSRMSATLARHRRRERTVKRALVFQDSHLDGASEDGACDLNGGLADYPGSDWPAPR